MTSSFIASRVAPVITPANYDFFEVIDEAAGEEYAEKGLLPQTPGRQYADYIGKLLGFYVQQSYPLAWDESGCFILSRHGDSSGPMREFEYLAIVDVIYEATIIVGIPDAAALLQLNCLVRPMLMLQSESRFQHDGDDGGWDGGDMWDKLFKREKLEKKREELEKKQ